MSALESRPIVRVSTGISEIDWLLGGGWVPGCVYRLSGPPGCGKSTLALDLAARVSSVYASAEESEGAVRLRFDRLTGREHANGERPGHEYDLMIGEVSSVEDIEELPEGVRLVVVDSLHRLRSPEIAGAAGSNGQLLHAIEELVAFARMEDVVVLAISHVNREGDASGSTGVDHDADVLLEMTRAEDGDDGAVRVRKNRHGPAPRAVEVQLNEEGIAYEEIKYTSKASRKRSAELDGKEIGS